MNITAEKITEQLTIPMILSHYGYSTSRRKRIPCPLHAGKNANFCYTDKVFHCWTCGEKGNAIGLTEKLFNLSFRQAMMKLNMDFSLGVSADRPTFRERQQMAETKKVSKAYEHWQERQSRIYEGLCVLHRELFRRTIEDPADEWILALQRQLERWLDDNIEGVVQPWN